jgi:hypothetical protein
MKTNELKKGTRVQLANGWEANILGSARGTSCLCQVHGLVDEGGSVYSHDIISYKDDKGNWRNDIEYSPAQLNCKKMVKKLGY